MQTNSIIASGGVADSSIKILTVNSDSAMVCRNEMRPVMQTSAHFKQLSRPTNDIHWSDIIMKGLWNVDRHIDRAHNHV